MGGFLFFLFSISFQMHLEDISDFQVFNFCGLPCRIMKEGMNTPEL